MTGEGTALWRLAGTCHRTRDFHVYRLGQPRLLDLWRGNGRAWAGHRPGKPGPELRNLLARAGALPLPGPWEKRLFTTVRKAFPAWPHITILADRHVVETEISPLWADPALGQTGAFALLRPGLPPIPGAVQRLVNSDGGLGPEILLSTTPLGDSELCSPLAYKAAAQGLGEWIKFLREDEDRWEVWETPGWVRRGPYLVPQTGVPSWEKVFKHFLERNILLPPNASGPVLLPLVWSERELRSFRGASEEFQWNS